MKRSLNLSCVLVGWAREELSPSLAWQAVRHQGAKNSRPVDVNAVFFRSVRFAGPDERLFFTRELGFNFNVIKQNHENQSSGLVLSSFVTRVCWGVLGGTDTRRTKPVTGPRGAGRRFTS